MLREELIGDLCPADEGGVRWRSRCLATLAAQSDAREVLRLEAIGRFLRAMGEGGHDAVLVLEVECGAAVPTAAYRRHAAAVLEVAEGDCFAAEEV